MEGGDPGGVGLDVRQFLGSDPDRLDPVAAGAAFQLSRAGSSAGEVATTTLPLIVTGMACSAQKSRRRRRPSVHHRAFSEPGS